MTYSWEITGWSVTPVISHEYDWVLEKFHEIYFHSGSTLESDLQSGVVAGYKLLWVTFWASFLGFLMQRLSSHIVNIVK